MRPWFKTRWTTYRLRYILLDMVVAVCLAFLVWLYAHSRARESIDRVQVPVNIQLAAGQRDQFLLETGASKHITVSFSGPSSRIRELRRKLQHGLVQVVVTWTVPEDRLGEATFCETVHISPSQVPVPPGVLVEFADQEGALPVTLHRLAERLLPVKLDYTGEVRITQVKVEPAAVVVRGPKQIIENMQVIPTQPHALAVPPEDAADNVVRGQVALVAELEGRGLIAAPRQVSFRCKVHPKQKIYELTDVPVQFLCPPQFPWRARFADDRAGTVSLRLLGPAAEERPPVRAFIDLTGTQLFRGRNLEPLRLQLPKDFTLVQSTPQVMAFYLEEMSIPAAVEEP